MTVAAADVEVPKLAVDWSSGSTYHTPENSATLTTAPAEVELIVV